jgi:hypothetical protein
MKKGAIAMKLSLPKKSQVKADLEPVKEEVNAEGDTEPREMPKSAGRVLSGRAAMQETDEVGKRLSNLEKRVTETEEGINGALQLAHTANQLGIVNARQHARSLLSQTGQKPLSTEEQLELFMSELAAIGVPETVLEASQDVLQEKGYKTLEMQPVTKPKALSTGGD